MGKPALIELEGADGSEPFVLSGRGMGNRNVELADDPSGFYDLPVETIYTEHAFQKGSTYNGMRIKSRQVVFTVNIFGTRERSWELADDEFSTALEFARDAKLWFDTGESRRWLTMRLLQEPQLKTAKDPRLNEFGRVTLTCIAPDPFWYEPPVPSKWISPIDTTDGSTAYGEVEVSNPTPYPIWLRWGLQAGPNPGTKWTVPDFSFGNTIYRRAVEDADRVIHMPELLGLEHVDIDTDDDAKREQVRSPLDTQIYLRMGGQTFVYPIPPRTKKTKLPVAVSGAPAGVGVTVLSPRPWPRPWGQRR